MIIAALLVLAIIFGNRHRGGRGVTVSFLGYTNLPNNSTRFALFSLHSQDTVATRWRGNWVEVEGLSYNKAPTVNVNLPWFSGTTLKQGDSLTIAVGEPAEARRWRFNVLSSRYALRERALDFAMKHKLPIGIGRFSVIDSQGILNPTNCTTNTSVWLEMNVAKPSAPP